MTAEQLYQQVISEFFDVTDNVTRKTMLVINESEKSQILGSLANKLYSKIVNDVTNIDYGTIPFTKGDVTKMENFSDVVETLEIIRDIQQQYNQSTANVQTIMTSIDYLKKYQDIWVKAFGIDCEFVQVLYVNMCMAAVSATALLVSTSIEFIKNPETQTFDIALQRVSKTRSTNALMLKNLDKFNTACAKGDVEKVCKDILHKNYTIKEQVALQEAEQCLTETLAPAIATILPVGALAVMSLMMLLTCLIPILRELTVTFLNAKQSFSDYLSFESDVVRLNAERVKYNSTKTESEKTRIRNKQLKIADRLKKMATALQIKMTKATKVAAEETKAETSVRYKIDDVAEVLPDSAASLF